MARPTGSASTLFPASPLAVMLGLNLRFHLISKVTQPRLAHFGYRPLPSSEEPGQAAQADLFPTTTRRPRSVRCPSHSINPSSTITKYFHWRWLKQGRNSSANSPKATEFTLYGFGWTFSRGGSRSFDVEHLRPEERDQGENQPDAHQQAHNENQAEHPPVEF